MMSAPRRLLIAGGNQLEAEERDDAAASRPSDGSIHTP